MSEQAIITYGANWGGKAFTANKTVTATNAPTSIDETVPAGKSGSLTTRTNNTQGTITLTTGHGLTTGVKFVQWSTGGRRNVTCTITGDSCVITGGTGDNLPDAATTIVVSDPQQIVCQVNGDSVNYSIIQADTNAQFSFRTAASAEVYGDTLDTANVGIVYDDDNGGTSPWTGSAGTADNIYYLVLGNGSSTQSVRVRGVVFN